MHPTKHPTAIKFCGFTQADDIQAAVALGVDAVGLVFYPPSPRAVTVEQGAILARLVPPFISVVALVVNIPEQELVYLSHHVGFDIVQFHGDESALACQLMANRVGKRWIKALRVRKNDTAETIAAQIAEYHAYGASAILLDAYHADQFGGTGQMFDWGKLPQTLDIPIILAGGLTAENVPKAIAQTRVYGVDVSGGIESSKGVKSMQKMTDFIQAVRGSKVTDDKGFDVRH